MLFSISTLLDVAVERERETNLLGRGAGWTNVLMLLPAYVVGYRIDSKESAEKDEVEAGDGEDARDRTASSLLDFSRNIELSAKLVQRSNRIKHLEALLDEAGVPKDKYDDNRKEDASLVEASAPRKKAPALHTRISSNLSSLF